jgi:serine/threonine protein kinase/TolB-like protein/Tfp pilus assembly protein PilF
LAGLRNIMSGDEFDPVGASGLNPGARVGPYEVIRLLGSGGMAEVWLARRADGAFKRDVALKLPLLTRRRKDLEQRFVHERDILASLEHPNIARFYDAGVDADGLPYLSMEYVQGQTLMAWCDTESLGIPERLALFLQVLDAVKYAHEKHVIHRDLKPSNILVTESGQVRLLDFGVAKLLQDEGSWDQTQLSGVYGQVLTPDYASPELLSGGPVDTRSDVYSLGVVLYELLSGARPYRLNAQASSAVLGRNVAAAEVKRPSAQLTPQACVARASTEDQLARKLRGDLDAIVLKALAKEPAERYDSAASIAEDLRRHLREEPIKARSAPLLHRAGKFLRRNKAAVWLVALSAIAVLAAVGVDRLILPRHVDQGAPTSSFAAPARSVAVLPFVNMSADKEQTYFSDGLTEELIDLLGRVPDLRVPARTSSFYFKGKDETIANIAMQLRVRYVLEGSVRKSGQRLRITTQLIRADNAYLLWSQTYDRDDSDVFAVQDDIARAVVAALQVKLAAGLQVTGSRGTSSTEAYDQYLLGRQLHRRGSLEGYRLAVAAYSKAIALDPNYAAAYAGLALAEAYLADLTGDTTEGIKRAQQSVDKAIALAPTDAIGHAARSFIRATWLWDWSGAQADIEKALIFDPRNSDVQHRYASLLDSVGRLSEAVAAQKYAVELDPLSSNAWENLGRYYTDLGDYAEADAALVRAIDIEPTSVFALNNLGTLRLLQGKGQEALEVFQRIDSGAFRLYGIAMAQHTLGNVKESRQALEETMEKYAEQNAYQIAEAFGWCGEKEQAFKWLERAYQQRDGGLSEINDDPALSSVHADPRYKALLRRINLAD